MKTPGWGKAIGIIMIILGSFGTFYQAYKIFIPKMMEMQEQMMTQMSNDFKSFDDDPNNEFGKRTESMNNIFKNQLSISDTGKKWLPITGILGILLSIYYIIGGALLLKAKAQNYKIAISSLIAFMIFNICSYLILFSGESSFILIGVMIYSFIGFAFDVALLIIALASDKSKYGIGQPPTSKEPTLDGDI